MGRRRRWQCLLASGQFPLRLGAWTLDERLCQEALMFSDALDLEGDGFDCMIDSLKSAGIALLSNLGADLQQAFACPNPGDRKPQRSEKQSAGYEHEEDGQIAADVHDNLETNCIPALL